MSTTSIFALSVLGALLICYIIAIVRTKRGHMAITVNLFDKILVLLAPILFFVVWCIGFDHSLTPLQIILLVVSVASLLGSLLFSIVENRVSFWNVLLSVLAKIFIFILTVLVILLLITILFLDVILSMIGSRDREEPVFVVKYDHFLDQWVGYRVQ